jgi:hypothetical protein
MKEEGAHEDIKTYARSGLCRAYSRIRHVHYAFYLADPKLAHEFVADLHHAAGMDSEPCAMGQLQKGANDSALRRS